MDKDICRQLCIVALMPEVGWRARLAKVLDKDALKARGLTIGKVAKDAGLHRSQLYNILKDQDPSIENLSRICRAANSNLVYVLFGWPEDTEVEDILVGLAEMDPEVRAGLLQAIAALRPKR